jgi:hypothetical protein
MLVFSLGAAKSDYDQHGLLWEESVKLVDAGLVDPRAVSFTNWTWIPYFYHEESFTKRLREANGDKYKITQVHTWWDDPDFDFKEGKIFYVPGSCLKTSLEPGERVIDKIEAKSLFTNYEYCVILKN